MTEKLHYGSKNSVDHTEALSAVNSESIFADPIVQLHLIDPSTPATELSQKAGVSLQTVVRAYALLQQSETFQTYVTSLRYHRRLMTMDARRTVTDWAEDPQYAKKVLNEEPVSPRTLEVHATEGVCNQGCTMCLWSNKKDRTYTTLGLKGDGLMTNTQWIQTIDEAQQSGTKRVVFSGGGEPLLRRGLFEVVHAANEMGLSTQLYSNGFSMDKLTIAGKQELLQMEQIRFSVHSPDQDTYNTIVRMSPRLEALKRVGKNITELLERRESEGGKVKVGIGFVTQPINYTQIEQMAEFAAGLGVDFLNIRQDEVGITEGLTLEQRDLVAKQLQRVRENVESKVYGQTDIDMADDLIALADGINLPQRQVANCHMKQVRPAISPYGEMGACDLMVEPNFANRANTFGDVRQLLPLVTLQASEQHVSADCAECMPSGRAGNAMMEKLKTDYAAGIDYTQQPFYF